MPLTIRLVAIVLTAVLVASPHKAIVPLPSNDEGPPFVAAPITYADSMTCIDYLAWIVRTSGPPADDVAVGPYTISLGDVRAHRVKAQGWGHDIEEFRCLGTALSVRRWSHSMNDVKPFTIEDIEKMSFPAE